MARGTNGKINRLDIIATFDSCPNGAIIIGAVTICADIVSPKIWLIVPGFLSPKKYLCDSGANIITYDTREITKSFTQNPM